jgi:diguanylate cyclase (GGDEF)-like protein
MLHQVLLIDDSKAIHALARTRLAEEPVTLLSAYGGAEGLNIARKSRPEVILLDQDLPDCDSIEICRQLKSDPATSGIPVILLVGSVTPDDRIYSPEVGAADFIAKPFNPGELRARVRGALRTRRLLDVVENKARMDGETGVWGREYFEERLVQELSLMRRSGQPLSCILVDIDNFASLNETHGRGFGDEVIRETAVMLEEASRLEDIVCRYGPDEFIILSPSTTGTGAEALAARCQDFISNMNLHSGKNRIPVTCSFGVAEYFDDESSVIERAEKALQCAKAGGGDRVTSAGAVAPAMSIHI